jgi:hypothetical protein
MRGRGLTPSVNRDLHSLPLRYQRDRHPRAAKCTVRTNGIRAGRHGPPCGSGRRLFHGAPTAPASRVKRRGSTIRGFSGRWNSLFDRVGSDRARRCRRGLHRSEPARARIDSCRHDLISRYIRTVRLPSCLPRTRLVRTIFSRRRTRWFARSSRFPGQASFLVRAGQTFVTRTGGVLTLLRVCWLTSPSNVILLRLPAAVLPGDPPPQTIEDNVCPGRGSRLPS